MQRYLLLKKWNTGVQIFNMRRLSERFSAARQTSHNAERYESVICQAQSQYIELSSSWLKGPSNRAVLPSSSVGEP